MTADTPMACAPSVETPAMTADTQAPAPTGDMQARCAEIVQWRRTGLYAGTALRALADTERYSHYGEYALRRAEDDTLLAAAEAFAAAPSPSASTIGVKELEWARVPMTEFSSRAETEIGVYRTWTHHEADGEWYWSLCGLTGGAVLDGAGRSEAEVQAAAQADFTRRIQSCMTTSLGGEDVGMQGMTLSQAEALTEEMRATIISYEERDRIVAPAYLTLPKAETETASERDRLVEAPSAWAYEWAPFDHEQWQHDASLNDPLVHGGVRRYRNVRPLFARAALSTETSR